jgi:hypothetical protein
MGIWHVYGVNIIAGVGVLCTTTTKDEMEIIMYNDIRHVLKTTFQFWRGQIFFTPLTLQQVLLSGLFLSVIRALIEVIFWLRTSQFSLLAWLVLNTIMWMFYIISLYLSTAYLLFAVTPGTTFKQTLTMAVHVYWVIPLVPLFSLLPLEKQWGLGNFITIPFFQYIPTFVVEKNYLPLGMLAVIPFIIFMTVRFLVKTTQVSIVRSSVTTLLVYLLIYAYYYQWAWAPDLIAGFEKGFRGLGGHTALIAVNSFSCQLITLLLMPMLAKEYPQYSKWLYLAVSGFILLVLFFLPVYGVYQVFFS